MEALEFVLQRPGVGGGEIHGEQPGGGTLPGGRSWKWLKGDLGIQSSGGPTTGTNPEGRLGLNCGASNATRGSVTTEPDRDASRLRFGGDPSEVCVCVGSIPSLGQRWGRVVLKYTRK